MNLYSRSTHYSDGGHSVKAVTAHQVGDVIMELCLLAWETCPLKQLCMGRVVILDHETQANKLFLHFWFWIIPSHFSVEPVQRLILIILFLIFLLLLNVSLVSQHEQRRCGHPEHTTYQCSCTPPCQTCPTGTDVHGSSHAHMPPIYTRTRHSKNAKHIWMGLNWQNVHGKEMQKWFNVAITMLIE